ncbi:hypothetical protein CPB86DRAFT_815213 [Serendipita vermifera]|nr:hypothetical protein CPB86DRAFT_815213 [Serendipita vermifera]
MLFNDSGVADITIDRAENEPLTIILRAQQRISWPKIPSISTTPMILDVIFHEDVHIPFLTKVTLQLESVTCSAHPITSPEEPLGKWRTFLSIHGHSKMITTFGISQIVPEFSQELLVDMCVGFIQELPNISHLILGHSSVVPTLGALLSSIPLSLTHLTIENSADVTEEHIDKFIRAYHATMGRPLFLQIQGCRLLPEQGRERHSLTLAASSSSGLTNLE